MNVCPDGHKTTLKPQRTRTLKPPPPLAMADSVRYIPSPMDPLTGAATRASRQDPMKLMIEDAGVLLRLFLYVPKIVSPFFTKEKDAEFYMSFANVKVGILQTLLALVQALFLIMVVPAFVLLPGGVFLVATAFLCLACYLMTLPMQGPPINYSNMDAATKDLAEQHKNERWVFVNGICTG